MNFKKLIILFFLIISINNFSQTKLVVLFTLEGNIKVSDDFSFNIYSNNDTIVKGFKNQNLKSGTTIRRQFDIHKNYNSAKGVFSYFNGAEVIKVEHYFDLKQDVIDNFEINLIFSVNNNKEEFLKEFSVENMVETKDLVLETTFVEKEKVPVFILKNISSRPYWNYKNQNGWILFYTSKNIGWLHFQGPHLPKFSFNEPLLKNDSITSTCRDYINFNDTIDAFEIVSNGLYKFITKVSLSPIDHEKNNIDFQNGKTLKIIRDVYLVVKEFEIK